MMLLLIFPADKSNSISSKHKQQKTGKTGNHSKILKMNLLKLVESFLSNRYQRVVLNGQASSCADVKAGVPQESMFGSLFFLIYINDLSEKLKSTVNLFADDTSIFHVVKDRNTSAEILNYETIKNERKEQKARFLPVLLGTLAASILGNG